MSIYIKNMELPKGRPVCIVIDAAGQARRYDLNNDRYADDKLFEAVPVPPHGDLIERDKLVFEDDYYGWRDKQVIKGAPTIIPASEEDDDD